MTKFAIAYVVTLLMYGAMDAGWLAVMGPRLYQPDIGTLLAGKVRIAPAVLFYLLYVAGLVYLVIGPNLVTGGWKTAAVSGAVFGLVAYGAYDLTCQAVMKTWTTRVSAADMAWGLVVGAISCGAGTAITRAITSMKGV